MKRLPISSIAAMALIVMLSWLTTGRAAAQQPSPEVYRLPPPDEPSADESLELLGPGQYDELTQYDARSGRWSTAVDAIFLRRSRADSRPLLTNQANGQTVLDAASFEFHYEISPRITLSRIDDAGGVLELRYFGIYDWNTFAARTGNLAFAGPGFTLGVNPASYTAAYRSRMHSFELNLLRQASDSVRLRAGLRYFNFEDRLLVQEFNVPSGTVADIRAQNHLYGGQVGGDMILLNLCDRLRIDGTLGLGLYATHSHQTTSSDFLGPPVADRGGDIAFHGELGLAGRYRITECMVLRFGYKFMWLVGLALAPEQIATTDLAAGSANIRTSGDVLLDGAHVGLEIVW